jgi:hypothetical protein
MRRHEPLDIDAALTRLAAQVDRLDRHLIDRTADLDKLRDDVDAHSRTLADLADLVRRLHAVDPGRDDTPVEEAAPDWLTVTDIDLAIGWLQSLVVWTRSVWTQYRPLPGCWPWHPPVVAELLVCHHVWVAASVQGMPAEALATWHDRWRPGVARRLDGQLAACERAHSRHVTAGGQAWAYDAAVVDELAAWWATTHGTSSIPAPGLTRETSR